MCETLGIPWTNFITGIANVILDSKTTFNFSSKKQDSQLGAGISLAIFLVLHMRELCNIAWAIFYYVCQPYTLD